MAATLTSAVKKGARLLDERIPGWAYRVRLTTLDVSRGDVCVLGQLSGWGDYYDGADELFGETEYEQLCTHGFDVAGRQDWVGHETRFARLTDLWSDEIRQRRGKSGTRC